MPKLSDQQKELQAKKEYNRKIGQRIEQLQGVLDQREIDLAVAQRMLEKGGDSLSESDKLMYEQRIARHKKEIENVTARIEEHENLIED